MGTHPVAREDTLRKGTHRSREVTLRSKVTHLHLELTHLHLGRTLLHLGHTLLHMEQREAAMGRRGSSPTSCTALPVLVVMGTHPVATGTRRSRGTLGATLHNKEGTLLSMGTPRNSMDTLHSSMDTPLPATLAHLATVVAMEEAWAWVACSLEAQLLRLLPTEHIRFLTAATVEVDT